MAIVLATAAIPRRAEPDSWRFRWPVQLCRASFGIMLLGAALAKVRDSGLDWVFSANMRNILTMENLVLRDTPLPEVALWISSEPWLWQSAAAGTILGEAALLVAVFARNPLIRVPAVIAGIGTVVGISLLMGLVGFPFVVLAAIFIEVDRAVDAVRDGGDLWLRLVLPVAGVIIVGAVAVVDTGLWYTTLPLVGFCALAAVGILRARTHQGEAVTPAASRL
jgi:hypothetical protein